MDYHRKRLMAMRQNALTGTWMTPESEVSMRQTVLLFT
jgi:hypothetical protein